jgi:hypothetical protein
MRSLLIFILLGFITSCATPEQSEKRTYVPRPPEVVVTVRHLDHGKPLGYRFVSHDPQASAITEQRFEVTAPDELKGRVFSIKILYGYEAPLQTAEYFHLRVPRYIVDNVEGPRKVGDQFEFDDGWNFAALVVDESPSSEKK